MKGDIRVLDTMGRGTLPTVTFKVQDQGTSGGSTVQPGEPVKISGAEGGNYVIQVADGEPAIGTDIFVGVAASESTETSSEDGEVEVYPALPGVTFVANATNSANLADSILYNTVTFDLSSSTFTVDEDEGTDEDVHGLRIMNYDSDKGTVEFMVKDNATILGCSIA